VRHLAARSIAIFFADALRLQQRCCELNYAKKRPNDGPNVAFY